MKPVYSNLCLIGLCMLTTAAFAAPAGQGNTQLPEDFPLPHYQLARFKGQEVLSVDPAKSLVVIEVRRAGWLPGLGHDHIVASHNLNGYITMADASADLYIPLSQLAVDEAELRSKAGFDTQPSPSDIAGTRRNMLEKTLDAEHFPDTLIHVTRPDAERRALAVAITLHGMTHSYAVDAKIETLRDGIAVDGKMSLKQSDFGITPLSILGGAIQVKDELALRFHIVAHND